MDKRMTAAEVVAELRSGMTLGIGGWGSRRKPMALVREILRSDLRDLTVVTYGATVNRAMQASRLAQEKGISMEILDLRSLNPVDWDAIGASVRKTSKVLVLTEDSRSWGYGAELAARIGEELYTELDGPVRRLAATDTFVAYAPELEDFILPQTNDILKAVEELAAF